MNVSEPVRALQIRPFLARAEKVLGDMGASPPEIEIAIRSAKDFLWEHVRKPPPVKPVDPQVREWARSAVHRHRSRTTRAEG